MIPLSCAEVRDLAAELALDALDGDQRATVLAHLDTCAGCREAVDELARTADTLLAALPAHDLPPELSARLHAAVPHRIESAQPEHADARSTPAASPWRHTWLAAAAALLVVIAGVVLTVRSADAPGGGRGEFDLVAADGASIGSVSISGDGSPWISMTVERGDGSATLTCVVVLDDASTVTVGLLSIADGKGSWGGPLGPEPDRIESAKLLDGSGAVVATAAIE